MAKKAASEPVQIFTLTRFHEFRPVTSLSFLLNYLFSGLNPAGYHLLNLAIHAVNSILVYYLILQITKDPRISLPAALLFVVSYSHFGSVAWISGRTGLIGGFFYLSTFLLFLKGGRMRLVSILFYVLSLLSVEYTFTLPFLLLAYQLLFGEGSKDSRYIKEVLPFFVVMILFLFFQYSLQIKGFGAGEYALPPYRVPEVITGENVTRNFLQVKSFCFVGLSPHSKNPFIQTHHTKQNLINMIKAFKSLRTITKRTWII